MTLAFQDYYPENLAVCYGCGRLNEHGYQIKSHWDGDESVCTFLPMVQPHPRRIAHAPPQVVFFED